jgi:hypothetical protein
MTPLILIGFLTFVVVALLVGVRLLLLWRRTHQLPELLMGIGVLGIGPVGFGGMMIGVVSTSNPPLANAAFAFGTLAVIAGVLAKCIFNCRVYRPHSIAAIGATCVVATMMTGVIVVNVLDGQWAPTEALAWDALARSVAQVGCLLWGSAESLCYWSKMKKREKIGLADAVVVNRFLLWGLGAGFAGTGTGIGVTAEILLRVPSLEIPWVVSSSSAFGFAAAVAIYLAFAPPQRYLGYIRARA